MRRHELSDRECSIIEPLLPNNPRGVPAHLRIEGYFGVVLREVRMVDYPSSHRAQIASISSSFPTPHDPRSTEPSFLVISQSVSCS